MRRSETNSSRSCLGRRGARACASQARASVPPRHAVKKSDWGTHSGTNGGERHATLSRTLLTQAARAPVRAAAPQKRARRAHVRHGLGGPLVLAVVDAGPRAVSRQLSRVCDAAARDVDARIVRGTHPHAAQEERRQRPHRRRRRSSSGLANRREEQRGGPTHRELRRRTGGERGRDGREV